MTATLMANARFHRLDHLTMKGFRNLDRSRTVVLMPIGMVEEHGNHLPLGTDNFAAEAVTLAAAAWLLENDGTLHVLYMPLIPFGTDPVDRLRPELFSAAGSVWISRETLKSIIRDVVAHLVRYGFRFVFPIGFHGGPDQSVALEEICAELRGAHQGLMMYEPTAYVMAGAERDMTPGLSTLLGRPLSSKEDVALKASIHASMFETSVMLHLKPELVDPTYRGLRTIEWRNLFEMEDWPGYVGTGPSHADAEVGGAVLRWRGVRAGAVIRRALAGEDIAKLPRHPIWRTSEDDAEPVGESPTDGELPTRTEPEVDSKPEMFISREKLSEAKSQRDAEEEIPTQVDKTSTPASASMETRPKVRTPRKQSTSKR